ncbi:MAG: hypothetical protein R2695_19805 [Acidimicrobiales bacterium]
MTFNPGLTGRMERVREFTDVRRIQQTLLDAEIELGEPVADDADGERPRSHHAHRPRRQRDSHRSVLLSVF